MRPRLRRIKRRRQALETKIYEGSSLLSSHPYCQLPSHFFDRALQTSAGQASANAEQREILTVASWDGRSVMKIDAKG